MNKITLLGISIFLGLIPAFIVITGFFAPESLDSLINICGVVMIGLAGCNAALNEQENKKFVKYLDGAKIFLFQVPLWIITMLAIQVMSSSIVTSEGTVVRAITIVAYAVSACFLMQKFFINSSILHDDIEDKVSRKEWEIETKARNKVRNELNSEHKKIVEALEAKIEKLEAVNEIQENVLNMIKNGQTNHAISIAKL